MARMFSRLAAAAACAAALSLAASPAMARPWHGRYYHHHGVSGGDVLAGALILGGIAAVASAANRGSNDGDYRDYRASDPAPYNRSSSYSGVTGGGIDNAVNMCVTEVERGRDRVSAVDNAARTPDGWKISGQLSGPGAGGPGFSCWIDNDGRIRNVDLGSGGQAYDDRGAASEPGSAAPDDSAYDGTGPDNRPVWHGADAGQDRPAAASGQWDDSSYARARAQVGYGQN
ncbi:MAG: hypothetical protein P0Y56_03685 [Candidatus Andeanibacterium colombiense]|uniref:Uncharacterized protein n=1 Tax=Candidatus Andeanibacterium colombiense TaxID=3121345 RepID=A0AAJ5X7F6_9SPHN|nr:MAG: hypothetical protein P0Y56_03685 [Sphingomonadaceae bacterium]